MIVNNWKGEKGGFGICEGERQIDTRVMLTILLAVLFGYTIIQRSKPHLFDANHHIREAYFYCPIHYLSRQVSKRV